MEHQILEDLFVDYIIEKVGPNLDKEKVIKNLISTFESLIVDALSEENSKYSIKVIPFGSFPSKLYLYNSDLDLSVLFVPKNNSLTDCKDSEFINRTLTKISKKLETNKEITNISIIHAEIKLIKCKMKGIPIDISISNYLGLSKLFFVYKLESEILIKEQRIALFKRSIILIKAWCSLESEIIGSNKSLMASYAIECLVIFLFNQNNEKIKSEIDAFIQFFELVSSIDFEKSVVTILGVISTEELIKYIKSEDYETNIEKFYAKNKGYFDSKKIIEISKNVQIINELDNKYNNNKVEINKNDKNYNNKSFKSFMIKKMNIIDPLNSINNLGKSINYYSYNKIVSIFKSMNKTMRSAHIIFRSGKYTNNPLVNSTNYLNFLMGLFPKTLAKIFSDIEMYLILKEPISTSDLMTELCEFSNDTFFLEDVSTMLKMNYETSLNEKMINEFNLKFKISKGLNFFDLDLNIEDEKNQNIITDKNEDSEINDQNCSDKVDINISTDFSLYLNAEILKEFSNSLDYGNSYKKFKEYHLNKITISFINDLISS